MSLKGMVAIGSLALGGALLSQPASALVPIPIGSPDGSATDLLTIDGTYTPPLPTPLAPPFEALPFTLSLTIPAKVTVSAAGPVVSEFTVPVTGLYTNNGQTEHFSTAYADFGGTNIGLPTYADNFSLVISGLLQPSDSYVLSFQASGPLFSPTTFTTGAPETITVGDLDIADAYASYAADPAFTGTVDISPQAIVPEPTTWSLMLVAFGCLGATLRRARRIRPAAFSKSKIDPLSPSAGSS